MTLHHLLPGALGSRAASLPRKASTLLCQMRHETSDVGHFHSIIDSVVSFCTDMGTELGIADITKSGWAHFHESLRLPEQHPIVQDDGTDAAHFPDSEEAPQLTSSNVHLFRRALPIPGVLHIISSCTEMLHTSVFTHRAEFIQQLSAVTRMLCTPHLLELFLQTCIRNETYGCFEHMFKKSFDPVIEWRWTSLTECLSWFLPLEGPLRAAWRPGKFASGWDVETHVENKFQILRQAIPNSFFWSYAKMMFRLQRGLDEISFWAENCPCHEKLFRDSGSSALRECVHDEKLGQTFFKNLDLGTSLWRSCPLRGKRAPELACGHLQLLLSQVHLIAKAPVPKRHSLESPLKSDTLKSPTRSFFPKSLLS